MSRRLKVVVLPAWYPTPERPAWGIYVKDHVRAAALEHDVVVVSDGGPRDSLGLFALDDAVEDGIRTLRVFHRRSRARKVIALAYLLGVSEALIRLRREGFRPDLIHAHVHQVGWAAVTVGAALRRPVVISEHSTEFPRDLLDRGKRVRARLAFRAADYVCPVSESLRSSIEQHGISARFRVVSNTVDTSLFFPATGGSPGGGRHRMLLVAQMTPIKGVPYLLRSLAKLAESRRDFVLDVVGEGPRRSDYHALAHRLGIADLVAFHGLQPKERIAELMRESSFFVLPSLCENQPVVLIESMTSGLPVVATDVGGVPEIVDDAFGMLVPPADSDALGEAIEQMLEHHADYPSEALAAAARERFSHEVIGARWTEVYDDAIAAHSASGT